MTQTHIDNVKTLISDAIGVFGGWLEALLLLNVKTDCDSIQTGEAFRLFADNKLSVLKKTHIYTPKSILTHGYARIIEHNTKLSENPQVTANADRQEELTRKVFRHTTILACRKAVIYLDSKICKEWLFMQLICNIDDDTDLIIRKCDAELKGLSRQIDDLIVKIDKVKEKDSKRVTYYDYLKEFQIVTEKRTMSLKEPYSSYIVAQNLFYNEIEAKNKQIELQKNGKLRH